MPHYTSSLLRIVLIMAILMLSKVTWARCICDPGDSVCLNGCVSSARDCIEACDDSSVECFTGCINNHWPGTTFEDGSNDLLSSSVSSSEEGVVIPVGGVAATSTTEEEQTSPYLLTVFAGGKSTATLPAVPLTGGTDKNSLLTAATATPTSFLNTMSPTSFETTHTTITSLLTVTPNASSIPSSSSSTNNKNTSHGLRNFDIIDTWSLAITGSLLLLATYQLV